MATRLLLAVVFSLMDNLPFQIALSWQFKRVFSGYAMSIKKNYEECCMEGVEVLACSSLLHVIGECNSCFLNRPQTETVKRCLGLQGSQAAEAQQ